MRKIMIGLAPALIAMSGSAVAAVPSWRVSEVSGEVRLTENGRSLAAVKGQLLASGATITTGSRARAVIVRGEEFVVISPKSQLRVPAAETTNMVMQMIEDFGTAVFRIQKKSTPHFGVQTPYLAAVVKGTTFTVTVGQEGSSVQVTEGAVEVSTLDGGAADLVTAGDIAMVGASDLYQLTIAGEGSKVLRSDKAPAAGAAPAPAAQPYVGPAATAVEIDSPLSENPQTLSSVTDGLLDGSATVELAAAEFADQAHASIVGTPAAPDPVEPPPVAEPDPQPQPTPDPQPQPGDDGSGAVTPDPQPQPGDDGGTVTPDPQPQPGDDGGTGTTGKDDDHGHPGKDDGKDKPGKDDGKDKPGKDDGKDKPGKDDDHAQPGKDDDHGHQPDKDHDHDKPGKDDDHGKPGNDGDGADKDHARHDDHGRGHDHDDKHDKD